MSRDWPDKLPWPILLTATSVAAGTPGMRERVQQVWVNKKNNRLVNKRGSLDKKPQEVIPAWEGDDPQVPLGGGSGTGVFESPGMGAAWFPS